MPESKQSEEQQTPQPEQTLTIDDVYAKYHQNQPETPQVTPQPAPEQNLPPLPEPQTDFERALAQREQSLQTELQQMKAENLKVQQQAAEAQVRQDLDTAINNLSEGVDVPNRNLLKYYLLEKYDTNTKFREMWDNRYNNPRALQMALDAMKSDVKEHFSVKTDPNLMAAQMAMDTALKNPGAAPPEAEPIQKTMMEMSDGEFERATREWIRTGRPPAK